MSEAVNAAPVEAESSAPIEDNSEELESQEESEGSLAASSGEGDGGVEGALEDAVNELEGKEEEQKKQEKELKSLKKKLKLKVDGKEIEQEIDLSNDDEIRAYLQKAKAFERTSQEISTMKKQVEQLVTQLRNDPVSVLSQLGHNVDELAEKHLTRLVEEAKKSPEQIEREKMESELKALKEEKEKLAKEKEASELERLRNEQAAMIESDIGAALDKSDTILPKKSPWVFREIAKNMLFAMQNGYPQVTAKDVIPLVEQGYKSQLKEIFDIVPEETIEMLVGKNNMERLRKKRLKKASVKTATARQIAQETGSQVKTEPKEENKQTINDFFKSMYRE